MSYITTMKPGVRTVFFPRLLDSGAAEIELFE